MAASFVCTSSLVIFGGTGDLSRKKLIPALSRLQAGACLPADLHLVVTGRQKLNREQVLTMLREEIDRQGIGDFITRRGFDELAPRLHYQSLDPGRLEDGAALGATLQSTMQLLEFKEGKAPATIGIVPVGYKKQSMQ